MRTSWRSSRRPRVSVGMPVYNGERYLAEAVDSLLAQTYEDFEVIICDNASTDRTGEIARSYAALSRSEEHTSELSHDQISYAVFCLKKNKAGARRPRSAPHEVRDDSVSAARLGYRRPSRRDSLLCRIHLRAGRHAATDRGHARSTPTS